MKTSEKTLVLQVGVKAFIHNARGQYLLLKRSGKKYPGIADAWDIPGGRIVPGTPLVENLERELREETGMDLVGEPELIAAQDIIRSDKHVVRLTYRAKARGEVVLDTAENEAFRWVSVSEMHELSDLDRFARTLLPLLEASE